MITTEVYGRIRLTLPEGTDCAEITTQNGETHPLLVYTHNDADFSYDNHGYETATLRGEPRKQVAFTATYEGRHTLKAYKCGELLSETEFDALPGKGGFVEVSRRDPRYFALSDGSSYVPIGLNLVGCTYDHLPSGEGHFKRSSTLVTTGLKEWERWFAALKDAGANYTRIWLSNRYTEARTSLMGIHNPVALARFDALIELARKYELRLKLCLEHWRTFSDEKHFAYRYYTDPNTGFQLKDENQWFESPYWNEQWLRDIEPYLARCQNDPVVFAWELWNENECGEASFEVVSAFTERMLPAVKRLSPKNLVVNSLGSYDEEYCQHKQNRFCEMEAMDFQQVHRYLDQGAPLAICHTDPVKFSIDAVVRSRRADKPIILTETGAVNDCHIGPFRYYRSDHNGLIFHDVTYPALFAGAAGSGHAWHWDSYIEPKNLWRHFKPMAQAIEGIQMDEEGFVNKIVNNDHAWILMLVGSKHTLVLVRNKADRWDYVLRDGIVPRPVDGFCLSLDGIKVTNAKAFWLMDEVPGSLDVIDDVVHLPSFVHGCVLRIEHASH